VMIVINTLIMVSGLLYLRTEGKKYLIESKTSAWKSLKQGWSVGVQRAIDPDLSDETGIVLPIGQNQEDQEDTGLGGIILPVKVCDAGLGKGSCCSPRRRCREGEGDCDSDKDCQDGLMCHNNLNNCRKFNPHAMRQADCCVKKNVRSSNRVCDAGLGKGSCCSPRHRCREGEGDCDSDKDCQEGLMCHNNLNNCRQFNPRAVRQADCCVKKNVCDARLGKGSCCSPRHRCREGEGDCDSDKDCQEGLTCHNNLNNCRQFNPRAVRQADCCVKKNDLIRNLRDLLNSNGLGPFHGTLAG